MVVVTRTVSPACGSVLHLLRDLFALLVVLVLLALFVLRVLALVLSPGGGTFLPAVPLSGLLSLP